jgi:hypothetical protein
MSTLHFRRTARVLLTLALAIPACDPAAPLGSPRPKGAPALPSVAANQEAEQKDAGQAAEVKRATLGKNVVLETQSDRRRVLIQAEVCFREGPLELFLCRRGTKEHEAVVSADIDARQVHLALIAAGAKEGSPVKFDPKYQPAHGTTIKITVEYEKDGKTVSVPAQQWVRDGKTRKELQHAWVFGGSQLFDHPDDAKQKIYAANGGDVICVANVPDAMLDLPVNSPQEDAERQYEAFTEHIPPLGTKVTIILEPVPDKK